MRFGLKENIIEQINIIFTSFPEVEEVIIYGSRAKDNCKPGSDIDLTLKGKKLRLSILNEIDIQLDDLLLPYTFDLSIFNQVDDDDLIDHINRIGVPFYKKEKSLNEFVAKT